MTWVASFSRWLSSATLAVSMVGLVTLVALLSWQVFARYVLESSPAWSEQAALVVMIGFVSLAAAAGVREGIHIGMTMAVDVLPKKGQQIAGAASMLVVAGFGVCLGLFGAELASVTWTHTIPGLGIPRGAAYLPLVASGWIMAFFALEQAVASFSGKTVEPAWNS
jgi:TRAP-type C4-dicarboxylate transport system permease small subunit